MDAFDADVLICAAVPGHPLGRRVMALIRSGPARATAGVGSVLLLPEVLGKPLRDGAADEVRVLGEFLARLDLRPVDLATAELATSLSARYKLRAADATHLATAVSAGADRFITNNQRDFPRDIAEVDVTYPADLPDPADLADSAGLPGSADVPGLADVPDPGT
jgi:predicted nucleic acid-binding protein